MVDFSPLLSHGWFILVLSVILTLLSLPLVIVSAFIYDKLQGKYPKSPKILVMLVTTFIAVVIAVAILEVYLGYTLPQLFTAP